MELPHAPAQFYPLCHSALLHGQNFLAAGAAVRAPGANRPCCAAVRAPRRQVHRPRAGGAWLARGTAIAAATGVVCATRLKLQRRRWGRVITPDRFCDADAPPCCRRPSKVRAVSATGAGVAETLPFAPPMQGDVGGILSLAALHARVPEDPRAVQEWADTASRAATELFFASGLSDRMVIEIDDTWHQRRGAAGGAHPETGRIVLDPSVHTSLLGMCATLLHEMVHLDLRGGGGSEGEEHSLEFVRACLRLNESVDAPHACFCRLGTPEMAVDEALLGAAGIDRDTAAVFCLGGPPASGHGVGGWDEGMLVAELRRAGVDDGAIGRVLRSQAMRACRLAMRVPGAYDSWLVRASTMEKYGAAGGGRDYRLFRQYEALWSL